MKKEEKKFDKKFVLNFAKHCMIKLVTKPAHNEWGYPEIDGYDLTRINKIIREFEK